MRILKKAGFIIMLLLVAGLGYGWYLFNKKPVDIRMSAADITVDAPDLLQFFQQGEEAANKKYVDKVLIVSGEVHERTLEPDGQATVSLATNDPLFSITCSFYQEEAENVKALHPGNKVLIKGLCTGMLMGVVMNRCSIVGKVRK